MHCPSQTAKCENPPLLALRPLREPHPKRPGAREPHAAVVNAATVSDRQCTAHHKRLNAKIPLCELCVLCVSPIPIGPGQESLTQRLSMPLPFQTDNALSTTN